jgi:hypothetical protein
MIGAGFPHGLRKTDADHGGRLGIGHPLAERDRLVTMTGANRRRPGSLAWADGR